MTATEFLQQQLLIIAKDFPYVNIKYGYDEVISCHIVELSPQFQYDHNTKLDQAWIPLSLAFMQRYKYEEIAFISSDSSLSLKTVLFELNEIKKIKDTSPMSLEYTETLVIKATAKEPKKETKKSQTRLH